MRQLSIENRFSESGLDNYVEQAMSDWKSVGVAVAVVQGSEVIYGRGFGVREFGKSDGIDPDTLFQVGSTTKAFTTAALGVLVDDGKLRWDDAIIDFLPGFQLQDPWLTRHLTIRDAAAHRSGILGSSYFVLGIMDSDEVVRQLRYAAPEAAFRDSYRYNNLMYAVLGKVVEAAAGTTWQEFVRRRLLQPLKMTRTCTSPYEVWDTRYVARTFLGSALAGRPGTNDAHYANVAMPHGWDGNISPVVLPWRSYDNAAAAGSIISSAADMANWLILHLDEGRFEGQRLLKKETLQEVHAAQSPHVNCNQSSFDKTVENCALGWRRAVHSGHARLAHGGGIIGFPSYVGLLPDDKTGVVVLCNGPTWPRDSASEYLLHKAIAYWVFDRFLGAPARNWSKEFLSLAENAQQEAQRREDELRESRLANAPPPLPLERYAGAYEDQKGHSGRVNVRFENGRLTLNGSV